ncbi:hypothetical protein M2162_001929 [Streptomyces sp. SAI-041]|nr:hypothetical protein [Streptomyces sp. SAI-041]
MSRIPLSRLSVAVAATAAAVLLTAVPAAAHTEVEADKAQALAENVTVSFHAEAESDTSGIKEVRVVLPAGITPADVSYGKGPEGWKFSTTDDGYAVGGKELKTGESAEYSVVVRQLPDAEEVPFKTPPDLRRRARRPLDRAGRERGEPGAGPEAEGGGTGREGSRPLAERLREPGPDRRGDDARDLPAGRRHHQERRGRPVRGRVDRDRRGSPRGGRRGGPRGTAAGRHRGVGAHGPGVYRRTRSGGFPPRPG